MASGEWRVASGEPKSAPRLSLSLAESRWPRSGEWKLEVSSLSGRESLSGRGRSLRGGLQAPSHWQAEWRVRPVADSESETRARATAES